eukprot:CAMPEP_0183317984 /NCGR_PEP_ID=MMETSP0160_2-20130417/59420_1 /TAXON_ID=2839 ORGANISM="Odontella Sinensis, Strain Grunow 1884" /NCGR_SAMPLE_ID=MMETSP0160_2 /ASSEMBLY_ACC=CAM_ASM_000250 /LENGTH=111 /DNA_ID=CAMNT_0025484135 /DNA_START=96 /DNA_END=431 /DNA_ORIENTATION=-
MKARGLFVPLFLVVLSALDPMIFVYASILGKMDQTTFDHWVENVGIDDVMEASEKDIVIPPVIDSSFSDILGAMIDINLDDIRLREEIIRESVNNAKGTGHPRKGLRKKRQ